MKKQVVFIGSGNLATALAKAMYNAGHTIAQIYSPTLEHAANLAAQVEAKHTNNPADVLKHPDLYVIAVKDEAIAEVVRLLDFGSATVAHTSGSTSMDIFAPFAKSYGVLYPLQTFSKGHEVSFEHIPIFIEGSSTDVKNELAAIAQTISSKVFELNSENRLRLHVAAVFACNFTNHMYAIADNLMLQSGLSFSLLHELISETTSKALAAKHPVDVQTGPAVRNDFTVIGKHLQLIADSPELQTIYQQLTNSIISYKQYSKNNE